MEHAEDTPEFCTIKEAARRSGLAAKTWYDGGAGTADVPRIRFGRSIRLLRKDVEGFVSARIVEAERATAGGNNRRVLPTQEAEAYPSS